MKFAEALASLPRPQHGTQCTMCHLLTTMPDDERADVEAAMASPVATTVIHRALKAAGYSISLNPVSRHRRGECSGLR